MTHHDPGVASKQCGFTLPLSATGWSSLVPPPTWHYAVDCLTLEYWADPEAVAAVLPAPLDLHPDAGRIALVFNDIPSAAEFKVSQEGWSIWMTRTFGGGVRRIPAERRGRCSSGRPRRWTSVSRTLASSLPAAASRPVHCRDSTVGRRYSPRLEAGRTTMRSSKTWFSRCRAMHGGFRSGWAGQS